jgi:hypothetical protein
MATSATAMMIPISPQEKPNMDGLLEQIAPNWNRLRSSGA